MIDMNPIADLLHLPHDMRGPVTIGGREYDYYPASADTIETLYRANPGFGVSNPGFSLFSTPIAHHAMVLGQYLARRQGVKRAEAEAITAAARLTAR